MDILRTTAFAALAFAAAGAAQAHVALTPRTAEAASYQVLRFGVGHGCDGQATTELRIEIPDGVTSARPQPKPGWSLRIERAGDRVRAISWRGELPADQFDEFLIQVRLPAQAGPTAFPAVQTCGAAQVRWAEPPGPTGEKPKRPAPTIQLTPSPTTAGAGHHHH